MCSVAYESRGVFCKFTMNSLPPFLAVVFGMLHAGDTVKLLPNTRCTSAYCTRGKVVRGGRRLDLGEHQSWIQNSKYVYFCVEVDLDGSLHFFTFCEFSKANSRGLSGRLCPKSIVDSTRKFQVAHEIID